MIFSLKVSFSHSYFKEKYMNKILSRRNTIVFLSLFLFVVGCQHKSQTKQKPSQNFDLTFVTMTNSTYPVVVIGGGPGGLTAALYLAMSNLKPVVLQGAIPGGALMQSHSVRNWPGEQEITGRALMEKIEKQVKKAGAQLVREKVIEVDFSDWPYQLTTQAVDDPSKTRKIRALTCIIATGATHKSLGVPGENDYWGCGVGVCAVCDGGLYKNKDVAIVGGGDAAITEAGYLSGIARKVIMLVRRDKLRAVGTQVSQVLNKSNVEVRCQTTVTSINGNKNDLMSLTVHDAKANKKYELAVDGLFLAIGSQPNTRLFKRQLELDDRGYLMLNEHQGTSKQGIYAIGDVADPQFRQAITAAGSGCRAALQAQEFLQKVGFDVAAHTVKDEKIFQEKPASSNEVKISQERTKPEKKLVKSDGKVIAIKNEDHFKQVVLNASVLAVVDFYATWCGPCRLMAPILDGLAQVFAGKVVFAKVNVDSFGPLATSFGIRGIPTLVFVKKGHEVKRIVGLQNIQQLKVQIEKIIT
jgi:thioredoxin reductase (NADPH)